MASTLTARRSCRIQPGRVLLRATSGSILARPASTAENVTSEPAASALAGRHELGIGAIGDVPRKRRNAVFNALIANDAVVTSVLRAV